MKKKAFTYKKSGVNIDEADKFVNFISKISSKKRGNKKFNNIGGFGSISNLPKNIKRPKIVACTDGVRSVEASEWPTVLADRIGRAELSIE